jgi:hypothetical protein
MDRILIGFASLNWGLTDTFPGAYYLPLLQFIFNICIPKKEMIKLFKSFYISNTTSFIKNPSFL